MCGIAGMVRWAGLLQHEAGAGARMADTLKHRGPDNTGAYTDIWASLGHTRLSIIDRQGGQQPLSNEDGTIWVVFNGEIYNHESLRADLAARGHRLRSKCDTEVIVHLYEDHGVDFVHKLNGMFAIAIWDSRRRQLLLARDRMGVKPLYWHDDGRRIVFGSELKAVLATGDISTQIDDTAVIDYFTFGHIPAPRTIYQNVRKLEPGHLAICSESNTNVRQYWDIPASTHDSSLITQHSVEQFSDLLEDSIRIRSLADVPLGAFLSGGIDSAAVVAAMTRTGKRSNVETHTIGFRETRFDERTAAAETARLLDTNHHEHLIEPNAISAAERLAYHFDEPFADSSALPTFFLSKAAREHVTVALSGDGADELLGGYRRYRFDLAEQRWRQRIPRIAHWAAGMMGDVYPKGDWLPRMLRAKVTLQNIARDPILAHLHSTSLYAGTLPNLLLRHEVLDRAAGYNPHQSRFELARRYRADHLLQRLLYLDAKTLLPDGMLTKVDRASMAVGLEVREPLLDYRLVEYIATLPPNLRLNKLALRSTLRHWSLDSIANRTKKGFDVPLDSWFRGGLSSLAADLLTGNNARVFEWIRPEAIDRILRLHARGQRSYGAALWSLLAFEMWAREHRSPRAADSQLELIPTQSRQQKRDTTTSRGAKQEVAA